MAARCKKIRTEIVTLDWQNYEEVKRVLLDRWTILGKLDTKFKERGARAYINLSGEEKCLVHCGGIIEHYINKYKQKIGWDPNERL